MLTGTAIGICSLLAIAAVAGPKPSGKDDSEEQQAVASLKKSGAVVSGGVEQGFHVAIGPKSGPRVIDDLAKLPHLRWLELDANWLTDAHIGKLRPLSKIEIVDLTAPRAGDRALEHIAAWPQVFSLTVDRLKLTDDGLAPLARLKKLASLAIRNSPRVQGAGMKYLRALPRLGWLEFQRTGLRDAELKRLLDMRALYRVILNDEHVTDAAVTTLKELARFKKLDEVDLFDTEITSDGVTALRRALPGVPVVRANIAAGQAKLRLIGQALEQYRSQRGHLPPAALVGPDGKTLSSWRVALLPDLGHKALFDKYRLDQPWNSDANLKVLRQMPDVYALPGAGPSVSNAGYFAIVGRTAFFPETPGVSTAEAIRTRGETVMIVETQWTIPWTKPEDISYDDERPVSNLGGIHEHGFNALMSTGKPQFFAVEFPPKNEGWEEYLRTFLSTEGNGIWQKKIRRKLIARPAPDFTLPSPAGQEIRLSRLIAGKVALIAFSAVGCGPCRAEAKHLSRIYDDHKQDGLVVLTVDGWNEPAERVRKYVESEKLSQLFVINGDSVAKQKYHVRSWPMICWINHKGMVVGVHFGYSAGDEKTLEKEAQELLADKRSTSR
jgi:thiol-disulfide isomerase/thioredoxin